MWGSAEESDAKAEVLAALLEQPGPTYDVSVPGQPTDPSLTAGRPESRNRATRGVSAAIAAGRVPTVFCNARLT